MIKSILAPVVTTKTNVLQELLLSHGIDIKVPKLLSQYDEIIIFQDETNKENILCGTSRTNLNQDILCRTDKSELSFIDIISLKKMVILFSQLKCFELILFEEDTLTIFN